MVKFILDNVNVTSILGNKKEKITTDIDSESSDSDDDKEAVNDGPKAPVFHARKVFHEGCVNRIRDMTQRPHICATWGDTGHVQIWDFSTHLKALEEFETNISKDATTVPNQTPLVKFTGHKDKGIHYYKFRTVYDKQLFEIDNELIKVIQCLRFLIVIFLRTKYAELIRM
ncbi:glutamate-rich WD repeat-containing protein 1 [Tanacetum coccineum]